MFENKHFKGLVSIGAGPFSIAKAPLQVPFQLEIEAAQRSSEITSLNWFFHIDIDSCETGLSNASNLPEHVFYICSG